MREYIDGIDWRSIGDILGGGVEGVVWYVALFSALSGVLHACG